MTSENVGIGCRAVDTQLDRLCAGGELSQRSRKHLEECDRCRDLYSWMVQEEISAELPPERVAAVQWELKKSLRPVSPLASPGILALRFLIVFALLALPLVIMKGPSGFHQMTALEFVAVAIVLLCGAGLLSISLAWQMTPGSLQRLSSRSVMLILAASFLLCIAILFPWYAPEAFMVRGLTCLKGGLLLAAPSALLFWLLLRRGVTLEVIGAGASLGGLAGLFGATVLQLTCPHQDAAHLLVWHGGVLLISVALGALAAKVIHSSHLVSHLH